MNGYDDSKTYKYHHSTTYCNCYGKSSYLCFLIVRKITLNSYNGTYNTQNQQNTTNYSNNHKYHSSFNLLNHSEYFSQVSDLQYARVKSEHPLHGQPSTIECNSLATFSIFSFIQGNGSPKRFF